VSIDRRRENRDRISSLRATILIGALAVVSAACSGTSYTPEIAGVVTSREELADGSLRITLEDGRSEVVETHAQKIVIGGGVPDVGDLLLGGSTPTPWVARLARRDKCFWIGGNGVEDEGYITADQGLRLPEAADFDRLYYDETEHVFHGGGFCVNGAGEVTAVM
jgi:hypothetical protein